MRMKCMPQVYTRTCCTHIIDCIYVCTVRSSYFSTPQHIEFPTENHGVKRIDSALNMSLVAGHLSAESIDRHLFQ